MPKTDTCGGSARNLIQCGMLPTPAPITGFSHPTSNTSPDEIDSAMTSCLSLFSVALALVVLM